MMKALWMTWMNEPYYKLILEMRKLRYGKITIEVNEGVPVKIHHIVKSLDVNKMPIDDEHERSAEGL